MDIFFPLTISMPDAAQGIEYTKLLAVIKKIFNRLVKVEPIGLNPHASSTSSNNVRQVGL